MQCPKCGSESCVPLIESVAQCYACGYAWYQGWRGEGKRPLGETQRAVDILSAVEVPDSEIAEQMGLRVKYVAALRRYGSSREPSEWMRQQVQKLHKKGLTDRQIAEKLRRSYSYVYNTRRSLGLQRVDGTTVKTQIQQLIDQGMTNQQIAYKLGCSYSYVRNIRAGVM